MAGNIKCDVIQADANLSFKIATANVAFVDSTGLNVVGGNLTIGATQFAEGGQIQTSGIANGAVTNDKINSVANTKIDGVIVDNQIASISNTKIDGLITDGQLASVANTKIDGLITSDQIANVAANKIVGTLGGNYAMQVYNSPATWTKPDGLKAVKVTVIGGGGASGPGPITSGGTSSFGSFLSATGGGFGSPPLSVLYAVGGVGSGGQLNSPGQDGFLGPGSFTGGASAFGFSFSNFTFPVEISGVNSRPGKGYGGGGVLNNFTGGAGGGGSIEYINSPSIPGPVVVTVGAGGTSPAASGAAGVVIVEEFY